MGPRTSFVRPRFVHARIWNLALQYANKVAKKNAGDKTKNERKKEKSKKMSGSRVFLGIPSLASSQLRFNSFCTTTVASASSSRVSGMASEASSSSSPPNCDGPSASSAIDFLTLCHRLKVIHFLPF